MTPSTSRRIHGLSALSLIGLAISVYQSLLFYSIRSGTSGFKSACNLGKSMNCDAVMVSRWAELAFGIPLSTFAAGWFLALFTLTFFARNAFWRRDALRLCLGMTAFATAMSAFYFLVMMGSLKTYCLFCLCVEGSSVLALILALSLKSEWSSPVKPDRAKLKTMGLTAAAALAVVVAGLSLMNLPRFSSSELSERIDQILASPVLSVASGEEFPSIGPKDAPVTIVEFSDFQCPYCQLGAFYLNAVLQRYPGQVRLVFRNFPIDPACNSKVQHSMHQVACQAARAGLCAQKQGKFEAVYEEFFGNQSSLATTGDGSPESLAARVGASDLKACMNSPEIQTAIARDVEEGSRLGVESTPTFFINGHKVEGAYPVPAWNMMVDRLLAK